MRADGGHSGLLGARSLERRVWGWGGDLAAFGAPGREARRCPTSLPACLRELWDLSPLCVLSYVCALPFLGPLSPARESSVLLSLLAWTLCPEPLRVTLAAAALSTQPTPNTHVSSPQPGQYISVDCQECVCDPVTKSMNCHQKICPLPPACHTPGFVPVSMITKVGQCCPQYSCGE